MSRNTELDQLNRTDRAVSPVIGVILMVAITVILAAVIGTFVLDLGQTSGNQAPTASLTVTADTSTDSLVIEHVGGDGLQAEQTRIQVTNESTGDTVTYESASSAASFSVGGEVEIDTTGGGVSGAWGSVGYSDSGSTFPVNSGIQYTVTLIDTESQRVIFETTITA